MLRVTDTRPVASTTAQSPHPAIQMPHLNVYTSSGTDQLRAFRLRTDPLRAFLLSLSPLTASTALPSTVSTLEHVCPVRCIVVAVIEATCCLCFHLPLEKEFLCLLMGQPTVKFSMPELARENSSQDLRQFQTEAIRQDIARA